MDKGKTSNTTTDITKSAHEQQKGSSCTPGDTSAAFGSSYAPDSTYFNSTFIYTQTIQELGNS